MVRRIVSMRMTREEILEKYPSWNESRHDIVTNDCVLYELKDMN